MEPSQLEQLLSALRTVAFRRTEADLFGPLSPVPLWFEPFVTATVAPNVFHLRRHSHFLAHFIEEAEHFWAGAGDDQLSSGIWTEPALMEGYFSAVAVRRGSECFLLVSRADDEHARQYATLCGARGAMLESEAMAREIEKKEVLMHCIVHDLANPLAGMSGLLDLLQTQTLPAPIMRMVQLANDAASRQKLLIQQILDVFSAEASTLESLKLEPGSAPDLLAVTKAALQHCSISAQRSSVSLRLVIDPALASPCPVMAETTRLERIYGNLIENALRHAPTGSEVTVALSGDDETIEAAVCDAGSGVPATALPHLFKKLAPAAGGIRGKAGLGLYFCRITVERWGGSIGYRQQANGGACFWFRLRRYTPAA